MARLTPMERAVWTLLYQQRGATADEVRGAVNDALASLVRRRAVRADDATYTLTAKGVNLDASPTG